MYCSRVIRLWRRVDIWIGIKLLPCSYLYAYALHPWQCLLWVVFNIWWKIHHTETNINCDTWYLCSQISRDLHTLTTYLTFFTLLIEIVHSMTHVIRLSYKVTVRTYCLFIYLFQTSYQQTPQRHYPPEGIGSPGTFSWTTVINVFIKSTKHFIYINIITFLQWSSFTTHKRTVYLYR